MTNMEYRHISLNDMETRLSEEGTFAGYACRWNTVDSYATQFNQSAFSTATRSGSLPLLWMHNPDNPIGVFSWREDDQGLWIEGRYDTTTAGQDARARAMSGSASELSVGFIRRGVDADDSTRITAAELKEVSAITLGFASQPGAELMAVRKAAEIMEEMDERAYNPSQPRKPDGKFGSGGDTATKPKGGGKGGSKAGKAHPHKGHKGPHPGAKGKAHPHKGSHAPRKKKRMADSELETREEMETRDFEPPVGSYEAVIEDVVEAAQEWADAKYNQPVDVYAFATFPDHIIVSVYAEDDEDGDDGESWSFPYLWQGEDQVTLGEPTAVDIQAVIVPDEDDRAAEMDIERRKMAALLSLQTA